MADPDLLVPFGYGTDYKTLADLEAWLAAHHHPEYVRRLINWLGAQDGLIGVGGGWRDDGTQPDKPGFAPEGKSFHQNQCYSDGFVGACAVDLVARNPPNVHRAPNWGEVPSQDGAEAPAWGVHCNVSDEPWHMQPVEIDGWQSWTDDGCPCPHPGYPIPDVDAEEEPVTDDDIDRIAAATVHKLLAAMTTDPTVDKAVTVEQLWQYTRHAAANADIQTRP